MAFPIYYRKTVKRFLERTLRGNLLGFEAYVWAAQRITGLIILGFLAVHIISLGMITRGEDAYNEIMKYYMETSVIKIGELLLLWVLLFHALNGIRLILLSLLPGIKHKRLAYTFSVISLILVFISIPYFF